jgi:alkylresorcinol/alkylpyrone synthase
MQASSAEPVLAAIAPILPPNYVDQAQLAAALRHIWSDSARELRVFDQVQRSLGIKGRHLALPIADYYALDSFAANNDAWLRVAPEMGTNAARAALARAHIEPREVDHIFFVTVTGIATPSIDTRFVAALGMRPHIKRTPIFGLGCVAGAAGLSRAADYIRGNPDECALLVSVELCSLTLQRKDLSLANIIASGLFGDGAAAAVIAGANRVSAPAAPRIRASQSILIPGTEGVLGWEVVDSGFKIVLSTELTELIDEHLAGEVDRFLGGQGLARHDVQHWVAHAGGPKVLRAVERSLALAEGALKRSWNSLREVGNLSSASIMFTAADLIDSGEPRPGDRGMIIGMGPGFSIELVLLEW